MKWFHVGPRTEEAYEPGYLYRLVRVPGAAMLRVYTEDGRLIWLATGSYVRLRRGDASRAIVLDCTQIRRQREEKDD